MIRVLLQFITPHLAWHSRKLHKGYSYQENQITGRRRAVAYRDHPGPLDKTWIMRGCPGDPVKTRFGYIGPRDWKIVKQTKG